METYLGSFTPLTDEERALRARAAEISITIAEGSFDAYSRGELSMAEFVRLLERGANRSQMLPHHQQMFVGDWIMRAAAVTPPARAKGKRGPRGVPAWHRRVAVYGVTRAKANGAAIHRRNELSSSPSAFDVVANYLTEIGLPTTAAQVEKWYGSGEYNESA